MPDVIADAPSEPTISADPIFRLPTLIVHPTPLSDEIAATPWHVIKTRIGDVREKFGVDGSRVKAAIGDTGFDRVHCDSGGLKGRVVNHFDFTGEGPYDSHGHGSHVAGCALSMAPQLNLVNVKCLNGRGAGDDRSIASSIRKAADEGCVAYNGSFGSSMLSQSILSALEYAITRGCIPVIAGGNTGKSNDVQWPARSEYCISDSAIGEDDKVAPFSSTGPEIDTGWYGVQIMSFGLNGGMAVMSGSSMSTPLVFALLCLRIEWEVMHGGRVTRTVEDANRWLSTCCRDAGPAGRDNGFGLGIPDAMLAFPTPPPVPPIQPPTPPIGPAPPGSEIDLGALKLHIPAIAGDKIGLSF